MTHYSLANTTQKDRREAFYRWCVSTSCRVCMIALFVVFSLLYITKTSAVSTRGYTIQDLEKQKTTLLRDTQKLEVQIAANRSIASVEERVKELGMVPASGVEYLEGVQTIVAVR